MSQLRPTELKYRYKSKSREIVPASPHPICKKVKLLCYVRFIHLPPCTKRTKVFVLCLQDKIHISYSSLNPGANFAGLFLWSEMVVGNLHYCHLLLRSVKVLEKGGCSNHLILTLKYWSIELKCTSENHGQYSRFHHFRVDSFLRCHVFH